MARKYTKVIFRDDEGEIKRIIRDVKPNLKYIDISYIRDDRVVKLETNAVAVGDNPWKESTYNDNETMHLYRHGGDVAVDRLKNSILNQDGKLIGKKIHVDLNKDGLIEFGIDEYLIMDTKSGYCSIPGVNSAEMIEELRCVDGCEYIVEEMTFIYPYYQDYSPQQFAKFWFAIHKFNLFNQLDQYANLITYVDDYRIRSDVDNFWDAIKIPEPFRFCLNNYYLTNSNSGERFYLSKFQDDSELYKFYTGLPNDECKRIFIECAELERYTLRAIERTLSYRASSVLTQVAKSPSFFCDCMKKLDLSNGQDNIIEQFSYYVTQFEKHNMAIEFNNISRLSIVDKAHSMGMETSEFFAILDSLNTKNGLLDYLKKEYHK